MTSSEAIKQYFSIPAKPVSNKEMIELRRTDPKAYNELATACVQALEQK